MRPTRLLPSLCLLSVVACGGSSTGPNSGSNSCTAPLSATIDGVAWCSSFPSVRYSGSIVAIAGLDNGLTGSVSIGLLAPTTGTYSIAFGNSNFGQATYAKSSQGWSTGFAGGTGSVTFTTLTANHVVGTFAFDAVPSSSGETGTVHVTGGKFDITF